MGTRARKIGGDRRPFLRDRHRRSLTSGTTTDSVWQTSVVAVTLGLAVAGLASFSAHAETLLADPAQMISTAKHMDFVGKNAFAVEACPVGRCLRSTPSQSAAALYQPVEISSAMLAKVGWTWRSEHDSNYGFNLSLWDRLFSTYVRDPRDGYDDMTIGLSPYQSDAPSRLGWSLALPFHGKKIE